MKRIVLFLAISSLFAAGGRAQVTELKSNGLDARYVGNILGRSQKIVDGLGLTDSLQAQSVRNIIANRYFLLNEIHDACKQAKQYARDSISDKAAQKAATDLAELRRDAELYKHHFELASALSAILTDEQIDAVKDGMTFGRMKRDYQAQLDMIPRLTDEEKAQVLVWLKEAREFAIDAGDSKQKHQWFDKYRGRTNNWLSARGYDLKKEREAWQKRIEEQKSK